MFALWKLCVFCLVEVTVEVGLEPSQDSVCHLLISNFTGYTQHLREGEIVGHVEEVDIVEARKLKTAVA